ncbi:hypothetical protein GUITHDRAFT_147205 [Guillardia theta CCMP2712]|uniref:Uncharacterized protein n=2 Tax=Guillardia theta TaxID=55529 RepID=L1IE12_GUITC|nr:hypothetical protein GUITHDRAFT_147205 [Guillardia theta CCMP2712]EKX34511.1 hypothetical protein GUITHDRAFT_147205 [Guillardia theta CCMP2712]|eukprot:XP_005821491.1 hypothetical protein GUITHDRAFT_147205 [Guillardia theta CCMP2712]
MNRVATAVTSVLTLASMLFLGFMIFSRSEQRRMLVSSYQSGMEPGAQLESSVKELKKLLADIDARVGRIEQHLFSSGGSRTEVKSPAPVELVPPSGSAPSRHGGEVIISRKEPTSLSLFPRKNASAEALPKAAFESFRLVVLTCERARSLGRLLRSLVGAAYDGLPANLHVHQDRNSKGELDPEVKKVVDELAWPHGSKELHQWPKQVGIMGNWIDSWQPSQDSKELAIFLEDDLEVSRFFARWFLAAHKHFAHDESVSCFSAMRAQLRAADQRGEGLMENTVPETVRGFKYRLMGTWSFSPKAQHWFFFRQWFHKVSKISNFKPTVEGIIPSTWYEEFLRKGTQSSMWEMWYIRFMDQKQKFCVYPWVKYRRTLVANWREPGLHYSGPATMDYPVLTEWDPSLVQWPADVLTLGWDGHDMNEPRKIRGAPPLLEVIRK